MNKALLNVGRAIAAPAATDIVRRAALDAIPPPAGIVKTAVPAHSTACPAGSLA